MILWWLTKLAVGIFAAWFLRGVYAAVCRPRLTYRSHELLKDKRMFITVDRQEVLPPWRSLRETWLVARHGRLTFPSREGDGRVAKDSTYDVLSPLGKRLEALQETIEAREEQLKEMSK
jgi:hypothetical protein